MCALWASACFFVSPASAHFYFPLPLFIRHSESPDMIWIKRNLSFWEYQLLLLLLHFLNLQPALASIQAPRKFSFFLSFFLVFYDEILFMCAYFLCVLSPSNAISCVLPFHSPLFNEYCLIYYKFLPTYETLFPVFVLYTLWWLYTLQIRPHSGWKSSIFV